MRTAAAASCLSLSEMGRNTTSPSAELSTPDPVSFLCASSKKCPGCICTVLSLLKVNAIVNYHSSLLPSLRIFLKKNSVSVSSSLFVSATRGRSSLFLVSANQSSNRSPSFTAVPFTGQIVLSPIYKLYHVKSMCQFLLFLHLLVGSCIFSERYVRKPNRQLSDQWYSRTKQEYFERIFLS